MKIKYLLSAGALVALSATAQTLQTTQKGDTTIIKVENPTKYLILPIEEERPEAQLLLYTGSIQTAGLAGIHSAQRDGRLDGRVVQAGRRCRQYQHGHSHACCKQTCEKTFFHEGNLLNRNEGLRWG